MLCLAGWLSVRILPFLSYYPLLIYSSKVIPLRKQDLVFVGGWRIESQDLTCGQERSTPSAHSWVPSLRQVSMSSRLQIQSLF